jgi:uridine phosphorylase
MDESKPLPASTLVLANGKLYHLDVLPSQLSNNVVIVGDPGRVPRIAEKHLQQPYEVNQEHRGLRTITGRLIEDPTVRVSIVTSGMGQPSFEIVLGELITANEIDTTTRTRIPRSQRRPPLNIIRLGTSGALQSQTPLGTAVITDYAIGLDNTGLFYDIPAPDDACIRIEGVVNATLHAAAAPTSRFGQQITSYVSCASPLVVQALDTACKERNLAHKVGITCSNSGFFANQGRWIVAEAPPTVKDIDYVVGEMRFPIAEPPKVVENMEMEASILMHIGGALGYRCGALCVTVANRRTLQFLTDYQPLVDSAAAAVMHALAILSKTS